MKSGFKPKTFTKKEWQDNRSPACKASGVGKALDAWQKVCLYHFTDATLAEIKKALQSADALNKALNVAAKKCDKKRQKETLSGIGQYQLIINRYKKVLNLTSVALTNRKKMSDKLNFDAVVADSTLTREFVKFSKKGYFFNELDAYILCKKKKFAEAVKKYGKSNDYNVRGSLNKLLISIYIDNQPIAKDKIQKANKDLFEGMRRMLLDPQKISSFMDGEGYCKYLDGKFPLISFIV
jgi:hypothetical protein